MLATATYQATDPDEYAALIRGARIEVVLAGRGIFDASVTRVDLDRMWLQRGHEGRARTFRGVTPENRIIVWFTATPQLPVQILTESIGDDEIAILRPGVAGAWRSSAACEWASMSLPSEEFLYQGSVLGGQDMVPSASVRLLRPSAPARDRLSRLHAATFELARDTPAMLGHPDAKRGLEQGLIRAAFTAIAEGEAGGPVPGHRHRQVMVRFEALLEDNPERAFYIPEICAAIGVSDRNLRYIFRDRLDISPTRYLWLRRMHLARRMLQVSASSSTTVAEAATRHGFFELGRFAVAYRGLFGESPAVTLKRAIVPEAPIDIRVRGG